MILENYRHLEPFGVTLTAVWSLLGVISCASVLISTPAGDEIYIV